MPKNRKSIKHDGVVTKINVASKLRIGTRKSGTSATFMSTAKLVEIANDKTHKRDRDNAIKVLKQRGHTVSHKETV